MHPSKQGGEKIVIMTDVKYKQAQIINFFASKEADCKINKMKVYKLTWLADKLHLLSHGNFFSGDDYCAMKYGIVPSSIRDLTNKSNICGVLSVIDYTITSEQPFDVDVFTDVELDSMEKVWSEFGGYSDFRLSNLSHKYEEYLMYKDAIERNGGSYWIPIEAFFKLPENNVDTKSDFFGFDQDYLDFALEDYLEKQEILQALRDHHQLAKEIHLQGMN